MPTRMLRDWTDSAPFDGLSAEGERLFTRLIMKADDYGRFHAEPRLVRSLCFPLLDTLRTEHIGRWLDELSHRNLVFRYENEHQKLLVIPRFRQRLKLSRAKFPPPAGKPPDWLPDDSDFREVPGSSGKFPPEEKRSRRDLELGGEPPNPPAAGAAAGAETHPLVLRLFSLFNRRPTTRLSAKEGKAFQQASVTTEDLADVEAYYTDPHPEWEKGKNIRRRDLETLLNNWKGEVTRAGAWKAERKTETAQAPAYFKGVQ